MFGMKDLMGLLGSRVDPKFAAAQAEMRAAEHAERLVRYKEIAQPWTPGIKWEKHLVIRAATFPVLDLFPNTKSVAPEGMIHWPWDKLVAEGVASPTGEFVFIRRVLPAATHLSTYLGRRVGTVGFDEEVYIPCLFQRSNWRFEKTPWMSITPSELLSLRPGTKKARGRVCVAGLGLGHQLVEVANKKTVTSVVLVERNQELVDWLLPQIRARITRDVPIEVVVGNAYDVLPTLEGDVCLVDIYPGYGANSLPYRTTKEVRKKFKTIWNWGSAPMGSRDD